MPAPRTQSEQGSRRYATYRAGPATPMRGMRTRTDPASILPPYWAYLQNVRFEGDGSGFLDRGGAQALTQDNGLFNSDASTCIDRLYDFQSDRPHKLYIVYDGCPGLSSVAGSSLNWFDQEQSSYFRRGLYIPGATADLSVAVYDGRLYLSDGGALKVLQILHPDWATEDLGIAGDPSEEIGSFAGFTVRSLAAAHGLLFIGLDGGAGASQIRTYDGRTFRTELTGIDPPSFMMPFRDLLLVGHTTTGLHVRTEAASWSLVVGALAVVDGAAYRDNAYFVGATTDVWKFDGTTFASIHTVAGASMLSCTGFDGYLFVGYANAGAARLARMDSAGAWVDVHKDFTVQVAAARSVRALAAYRGVLVAGVLTATAGGTLFLAPYTGTSGTWTQFISNAANNGDLIRMVVY